LETSSSLEKNDVAIPMKIMMKITNQQGHSFLLAPLESAKVTIDCGANQGEFSKWVIENSNSKVFGFEPDPRLFVNLPLLDRVKYFQLAIDGEAGEFELNLGNHQCSSAIFSESAQQSSLTVKKTTLENFCNQNDIDKIDLLKIDIEGAELKTLEMMSDRFAKRIVQMTVEFHDFLRKDDVVRIENVKAKFNKLGFICFRFSKFTWGDCLFVNQALLPISIFDRAQICVFGKYIPGLIRQSKNLRRKRN